MALKPQSDDWVKLSLNSYTPAQKDEILSAAIAVCLADNDEENDAAFGKLYDAVYLVCPGCTEVNGRETKHMPPLCKPRA